MKYKMSVLLGAVSYGVLSTIVTKAYGKGYALGEVVGSQMLAGFALVWVFLLINKLRSGRTAKNAHIKTAEQAPSRLAWRQRVLLMAAGVPTAVTGLLYYQSLRYIPNSIAILLLFQFTWMGILIQALGQRRRPSRTMMYSLVVLLAGTMLAAGVLDEGMSSLNGMGLLFGLSSALSYSLFILVNGKAVPSAHPVQRSAWMITGGLLFVFVCFPPEFLIDGKLLSGLLPFGLLLGFFGAFLPPMLYAIGVPRIGEGLTGILGAAELPVAVILSSVVLHEHIGYLRWVGVAVVLLGVALPILSRSVRTTRLSGGTLPQ